MKTSENLENIFKAQIAMQSELTNIAKDSKGYGYNYTSLEKLIEFIRPYLAKHKLGYIQTNHTNEDGTVGVTTRLIHESGEWIEDTLTAPLTKLAKMNEYQVAGSLITYFRRYSLASMLGIASDEDIDMHGEQPQQQKQNNGLITDQQHQQLRQMIQQKNMDYMQVCQAWNMKNLAELQTQNFGNFVKWINEANS